MARTGRPREFDKGESVQRALQLFWEQGYEATSVAQLKAAMGHLSTASFYAAFGSKEGLFREALARYMDSHGKVTAALQDPSIPPRQAVEQALRASAQMQTDGTHPLGCLVVLATSTSAPENRHLQALLASERERSRAGLRACIRRAIATRELRAETDLEALVAVYDTFLVGLATAARDGVPFRSLDAGVTALMWLWDQARDRPLVPAEDAPS